MGIEARALALILSALLSLSGVIAPEQQVLSNAPSDILIMVNREHTLTREYAPELVTPNVRTNAKEDTIRLQPIAATALEEMFAAAILDKITLYAVSGYRSYAAQSNLYRSKVEAVGERQAQWTVAKAGESEHQTGLTMDVNGESTLKEGLEEAFGASMEGMWISQNAHRFGFIIRYPEDKTEITGYAWEPWHLRYVGPDVAYEIYEQSITLEEFYEQIQLKQLVAWVYGEMGGE